MKTRYTMRRTLPLLLALAAAFANGAAADDNKRYRLPAVYKDECGSCHEAYPAELLTRDGWRAVMAGLGKHFDTDASIDPARAREIAAFLDANAATGKKHDAGDSLRISRTPWFLKEHRDGEHGLSRAVWTSPAVKSPANCGACHRDAGTDDYGERGIRVPQ